MHTPSSGLAEKSLWPPYSSCIVIHSWIIALSSLFCCHSFISSISRAYVIFKPHGFASIGTCTILDDTVGWNGWDKVIIILSHEKDLHLQFKSTRSREIREMFCLLSASFTFWDETHNSHSSSRDQIKFSLIFSFWDWCSCDMRIISDLRIFISF